MFRRWLRIFAIPKSIIVTSSRLVPPLCSAINIGGPLNVKSLNAEMREPRQAGASMTLSLNGSVNERSWFGRELAQLYVPSFLASINNSCDPNLMKWISNFN
jgi:hypothetical protein